MTQTKHIGLLMGGGATKNQASGETEFHFAQLDMDRPGDRPTTTPLDFLAHGLVRSPHDEHLFLLFEKHGPGCCAYDASAREVRNVITTRPNRQFYGHGAFSPDGSKLYCTETDLEDQHKGYIAVRDGKDFSYLGDFPTHGVAPHDCMLRDDGKTLVITNGGSPVGTSAFAPAVTWVDVETGRLVREEPVTHDRINTGHLAMTTDGGLAVVSAPREGLPKDGEGGISLRGPQGTLTTIRAPADTVSLMLGETLSVAIHEPSGVVAATNPEGHILTFWNLADGTFIRSLRIPNPRGVAVSLDGREFVVTFGVTAKAARIDAETLEPVDAPGNKSGYVCAVTGSHIYLQDQSVAA